MNIEIYGFVGDRLGSIRIKVMQMLRDKPYGHEIVVTSIPSEVNTNDGRGAPFLRVRYTLGGENHLIDLLAVLRQLDIDIETNKLDDFIPRSSLPPR